MRIQTQLDEQHLKKLRYLEETTHANASEVIRQAIDFLLFFLMITGPLFSPPWPRRGGAQRRGGSGCPHLRRKDYILQALLLFQEAVWKERPQSHL